MKISEAKTKYIFKTKIKIGGDGKDYVTLREPTVEEMTEFSAVDDNGQRMEALRKLFPACIVDHTFTGEDGNKASSEEVHGFLKESSSLYTNIIDEWFNSLPFRAKQKGGVGDTADS
jgi:hypothetical protein